MPAVKGKSKAKSKSTRKKGGSRRKKPTTFMGRVGEGLSQLWSTFLAYTAVGLTALAMIVVLMLFAGGYFFDIGQRVDSLTSRAAKAMGFSVSRVTLKGGHYLTDREVMEALWSDEKGSVLGQSLLNFNANTARNNIENIGWVQVAAVQKLWPNTVHVSIVERMPRALWQDGEGRFYLIDKHGEKLAQVPPTDFTHLPVVTKLDDPALAKDILSSLMQRDELLERTAIIVGVNGRRFDLRFRNDFTAKLPEGNIEPALDRLEGLGAGTGKLAKAADYIDLRDEEWAYLRPKES